jgi:hypothetical protein
LSDKPDEPDNCSKLALIESIKLSKAAVSSDKSDVTDNYSNIAVFEFE